MIKLIQVALLCAVVFGVIYFMEEINQGHIDPRAVFQQKTQEVTAMAQQMTDNAYTKATDEVDDGLSEITQSAKQTMHQIMQ
jgi:hypothetical protein